MHEPLHVPFAPSAHWTDGLTLESTLRDLKLNYSEIEVSEPGKRLLERFCFDERLPGVILLEESKFGMVSREYFHETMSLPYRMDLFAQRPIRQLCEYVTANVLKLDGRLGVLEAAQRCLARPPAAVYEPIVVDMGSGIYRLLDVRRLLVAQSKLYAMATVRLRQREAEVVELNEQLAAENSRLGAEVEITHRIQTMLLPHEDELAAIDGLDIAGYMEPADEVGGDYYDVLCHRDRVKIGIGDVTGHGLESGMLMLMVQTAVRTLLTHDETDPIRFVTTLNQTIFDNIDRMGSDKHLTLALLDYVNCGERGRVTICGQHEEVIVLREDDRIEVIDTIDLGFPLGLEKTIAPFVSYQRLELQPGEALVLYTDGITEAENVRGELYGLDSLLASLKHHRDRSAREIQRAAIDRLKAFIGTQRIYDDMTLLVLKQQCATTGAPSTGEASDG